MVDFLRSDFRKVHKMRDNRKLHYHTTSIHSFYFITFLGMQKGVVDFVVEGGLVGYLRNS